MAPGARRNEHTPAPGVGRLAAIAAWAAACGGCVAIYPDRIHYVMEPVREPVQTCPAAETDQGRIVGLALSGGGSRAAVFGAAALEALWEHGLLGQITHVSSVSGGSFAASYFVANRPDEADPACAAHPEACWRDFFGRFKRDMRHNFFWSMEWRQVVNPNRFLSNTRRVTSLQEALDHHFLGGQTFGDLLHADGRRERPVLLINTTSFDDGRRLVFSNLCLDAFDGPADGRAPADRYEPLERPELRSLTFSRPGCARPVPADFPLSLAVAASASFPPIIGPVSVELAADCGSGDPEWWHIGDGGIIENTGLDTLEDVVLRRLRGDSDGLSHALLLSLDSGMDLIRGSALRQLRNFRLYSSRPALVAGMPKPRGEAYHDIYWQRLRSDLADEGVFLDVHRLRYTAPALDTWPDSCERRHAGPPDETAAERSERIRAVLDDIPTDLKISDCHADLVERAAHHVVHATVNAEMLASLRDHGVVVRPVAVGD